MHTFKNVFKKKKIIAFIIYYVFKRYIYTSLPVNVFLCAHVKIFGVLSITDIYMYYTYIYSIYL